MKRPILLAVLVLAVAIPAAEAQKAKPPKEKHPPREKAPKERKPAPEPPGESWCPEEINVEQRATATPAGWETTHSDAKSQLAMVTFFDGPPAERASLKYDSEEKQRANWIATWTLAPSARGYWLQCAYEHTTVVLSRRLPDSVTTCRVTYERKAPSTAGLPGVKHVGCK